MTTTKQGPKPTESAVDEAGGGRRIGVYVCHCGGNISDYVDVEKVIDGHQGRRQCRRRQDHHVRLLRREPAGHGR